MSQFYNAKRGAAWNYGGTHWKLSRSKIDLFLECPRCFYLDNKLGVKRVPGFPFAINSAVDHLLKQEFDAHRAAGIQHPLQAEYGLSIRPAPHPELDLWRDNFTGVQYLHPSTGMVVSGAIDDLWMSDDGWYFIVDYKSTAKPQPVVALDQDWQDGYKRQMEIYQWLVRKQGIPVSNTGYFVYCTGRMDRAAFDGRIDFDVKLIPYEGDDAWVEHTLLQIKSCLDAPTIPAKGEDCDHCAYVAARSDVER